ncbi:glycosyl hydrolase [Egicoccus halophilus]|uniref:Glycosyl hydrolase n=1 Tax=Egicoccus halophilus TaxID=1670830 RepID=A0A8J3EQV2_9ACTN|nr:glycosyl hydrolase [Egicoccus halophilus]
MLSMFVAAVMALAMLPSTPASGQDAGTPDPENWDNFAKVTLTSEVGEPMSMAVLPDGRVLHTNRQGQFRLYDPLTASTRIITSLPVYSFSEDGMQGIAVDPDFEDNGWVYVYYSPVIEGFPSGAAPEQVEPGGDTSVFDDYLGHNNLSRFQFVDDPVNPYIDLASEQVILEVPINRGICCHNGGDIGFDAEGNLFLSTGDDSNPFASNGYAPIDEREHRNPAYDAQRTSANTADLRGKLLRITVQEDGSYTVPEGNLFNDGEWDHLFPDGVYDPELALPEIYAMGFRNPFRFSVDPATGHVHLGDYGPDASQPNPDRGPRATVTWHLIDSPRNVGWPYCIGNNFAYVEYDFATGESGAPFDCAGGPVNDSPNNTGLEQLPPVTPADVWYHNNTVMEEFPELESGGGGPMGGPVYRYDPDVDSSYAFPEYYDGVSFFYEWTRNYLKQFHTQDGELTDIRDFLARGDFRAPMDMEFGPDGSLYVLEYGGGFFVEHPNAQLSQVIWAPDGRPPVARASAQPISGQQPLEVSFTSQGSMHPEEGSSIVSYHWEFGDGAGSDQADPTHTYTEPGRYVATLRVTDEQGRTARAGVTVVVGNTAPEVDVRWPVDGGFFDWGDEIDYVVRVTDREDGRIDCDRVGISSALGHDAHAHPMEVMSGCEGSFVTPLESGHGADMNLWWLLSARYTDLGAANLPSLTGEDQSTLNPMRRQAQHFTASSGITTQNAQDSQQGGGQRVASINDGDWIAFDPVHLANIDALTFRVAAAGPGGTIEVRRDAVDGELLGAATVETTGANTSWTDVTVDVTDPGRTFELFLVFTNDEAGQDDDLFVLNYFEAQGEGVAGEPTAPVCDGTITVGGRPTGVQDRPAGGLDCAGERIDDGRSWPSHGALVSHVSQVTQQLVRDGVLTRPERQAIIRMAAQSHRP